MNLELKHLAAYLPYDVKVQRNNTEKKIVDLTPNNMEFILSNEDKLILYPLSKLTQEIEHNGEKFVPIKRLSMILTATDINVIKYNINNKLPLNICLPHALFIKCHEWHIDTDCLIYNNLAISK